jgi:cystathionine beta-lyase
MKLVISKQLLKSQKNKVLLQLIILLQHHLQNPLDLGADVMHSTKYLAGHSDVMAGALIEGRIRKQMHFQQFATGAILGPWIAFFSAERKKNCI